MKQLLSGNEAIALAAYHAGVKVAAAYPGTPSTEILEAIATFKEVRAQWSPNEKVAMDVGIGASFGGVRALVCMKHVGLNVAADSFFAVSVTGVKGGLVVVSADDPGIHSSQNEQDNRHYARFAKLPMLEPTDSQEAYDLTGVAFTMSEEYDTPVMLRSTTRISHSRGLVDMPDDIAIVSRRPSFTRDPNKYVMVPANARQRHPLMEKRMADLTAYADKFPLNQIIMQDPGLGIITSGIGYQYAREVFPQASFLKLCMTYPFPVGLISAFAASVERLVVVEELDPFLEEAVRQLGIQVEGKSIFPIVGEFSTEVVEESARQAGLLSTAPPEEGEEIPDLKIPARPPVLCPGCPHSGTFFVLKKLGFYRAIADAEEPAGKQFLGNLKKMGAIIAGDIGCYTLAVSPPLLAMDTTLCMGASIGVAAGLEKAGVPNKVFAVLGDSTFLHSGITPLMDVVYNGGSITTIILDNSGTAMTGHQDHPGTGVTAQGARTKAIDLAAIARAVGVEDVKVVNAFDLKAIEKALRDSAERDDPSVVVVRGPCALEVKAMGNLLEVDLDRCNGCSACLRVGCPAVAKEAEKARVDPSLCIGHICGICEEICPKQAIHTLDNVIAGGGR